MKEYRTYYHASSNPNLTEIKESCADGKADFGGIFVDSLERASDGFYGDYLYEVQLKKDDEIADEAEIAKITYTQESTLLLQEIFAGVDEDDIETIKDLIVSSHENGLNYYDDNWDFLESVDYDDAAWELQCLRAKIAKLHGYRAIREDDGILIFPGAVIKKIDLSDYDEDE